MDCHAFRKRHLAFVDDTLPGVDVGRMQRHRQECAACAAWDHRIRRSLLVVRNQLSTIEPSAEFSRRLAVRLDRERESVRISPSGRSLRLSGVTAVLLTVVVISASALALGGEGEPGSVARLPAVVLEPNVAPGAAQGELPNATPAFMATMSTGMAILPALMLSEEIPAARAGESGVPVRAVSLTAQDQDERR